MLPDKQSSKYASEVVEFTVGSAEQKIELEECRIVFSAGTFDEPSIIKMSTDVDPSHWPNDYIGISPLLNVSSTKPLKKQAKIEMSTWCTGDDSEASRNVTLDVLHKANESAGWEVIKTLPVGDDRSVEFYSQGFSSFLLGLREFFLGPQEFIITGFICESKYRLFDIAFYNDSEAIEKRIKREIGVPLDRSYTPFSPMVLGLNEKLLLKLHFDDPVTLKLNLSECSFVFDEKFLRAQHRLFNSKITDPDNKQAASMIYLRGELYNGLDGNKLHDQLIFTHRWDPSIKECTEDDHTQVNVNTLQRITGEGSPKMENRDVVEGDRAPAQNTTPNVLAQSDPGQENEDGGSKRMCVVC